MERPSVYHYDDFRSFLRDLVEFLKESRGASYRSIAFDAGFSSPNILKMVADGRRGLRASRIPKIAGALELKDSETRFFEALIQFNQAKDADSKNYYYSSMARHREYKDIKKLERGQYEYWSDWLNVAIRELCSHPEFREDPKWISKNLWFPVTPKEIQDSIDLLLNLGLLERKKGKLTPSKDILSSGSQVHSLAVRNFHRQMMKLAAKSLEEIPPHQRDITSATVKVSKEKLPEIKSKIDAFRKELLKELSDERTRDAELFQVNFQVFPLSKISGKQEEEK